MAMENQMEKKMENVMSIWSVFRICRSWSSKWKVDNDNHGDRDCISGLMGWWRGVYRALGPQMTAEVFHIGCVRTLSTSIPQNLRM